MVNSSTYGTIEFWTEVGRIAREVESWSDQDARWLMLPVTLASRAAADELEGKPSSNRAAFLQRAFYENHAQARGRKSESR